MMTKIRREKGAYLKVQKIIKESAKASTEMQ